MIPLANVSHSLDQKRVLLLVLSRACQPLSCVPFTNIMTELKRCLELSFPFCYPGKVKRRGGSEGEGEAARGEEERREEPGQGRGRWTESQRVSNRFSAYRCFIKPDWISQTFSVVLFVCIF